MEKISLRTKILLKLLVIMASIIGKNVDGFYSCKLEEAIKELEQKD